MGKKMDEKKVAALIKQAPGLDEPRSRMASTRRRRIRLQWRHPVAGPEILPARFAGLALTALLASFMSGMAGNVTAFNTIWTYDLYQAYIAKNKSDRHYFLMGQGVTVVGILLSIACRLFCQAIRQRNGCHSVGLQLRECPVVWHLPSRHVLGPLHRDGRFPRALWRYWRLRYGSRLTMAEGKGGWLGTSLHTFPSSMAQNFWLAICALWFASP